ncbi:hypothetical protein ABIC75_002802 [Dyella japonica]|uniref:Uncharacterized protein n=1 Tax=Dyella japonica TaxID=231455 RepID=A0ABV2JW56_9GAMM
MLGCRVVAIWLACGGLPTSCRRPGYFSLLAQRKVTKRNGPRMTRLPGAARKVRVRVAGFFDRASLSCRKTGRHPCRPPYGLSSTRPPLSYGDPEEPRAKARLRDASASTRPSPRPSPARGEGEVRCIAYDLEERSQAKADARRGSALSPQRFGRVAQRYGVSAVWPPMGVPSQPSSSARAYPNTMLRAFALKAIFFGLLFFDSGHPALRPSGRLRRSHALLRMRGPAKEK